MLRLMVRQFLISVFLASAASPAFAQAEPVRQDDEESGRRVQFWSGRVAAFLANLNGRVRSDEGTTPPTLVEGTKISFDSTLEMDDEEVLAAVEFIFAESEVEGDERHVYELVNLSFVYGGFDGETTLDEPETFNKVFLPAGSRVESSFEVGILGADLSVVSEPLGRKAEGEFFVGLRIWDSKFTVESPAAGRTDENLRLGFVGIGVGARWQPFPRVGLAVRTGGYVSGWSSEDDDEDLELFGVHYEGSIALTFQWSAVRVQLGLRIIAAAAEAIREDVDSAEEYDLAFTLGGPFLDVSIFY